MHPALAPAEKLAAAGSAVEHLEVELHAALPHIAGVFVDHGGYFGALVVVGDLAGESGEIGRGERE